MTSSAKKKKEKKKDFQKAKFKVGKARPKASNVTDTSFRAKAITVRQQALSTAAPSSTSQFVHYLSLVSHKSDSQRRDALAYLTSAIVSHPANLPLPQPVPVILQKVQQLMHDGSSAVRNQLLKLLQSLPPQHAGAQTDELLLWIRAGLTHLSADIRQSALDYLDWLLLVDSEGVVSCAGGWVKTLQCFLGLLGWRESANGKWTSSAKNASGKTGIDGKQSAKQLYTLSTFIRAGLTTTTEGNGTNGSVQCFPLHQNEAYLMPKYSNAFGYLNLFGATRNNETEMYEDREDRQRVFHELFFPAMESGLEHARKEAGEVGRAAAQLRKAINEGLADFTADQ